MVVSKEIKARVQENCRFLEALKGYQFLQLPAVLTERLDQVCAEVKEKLGGDKLVLALVGGFSAGKSTLINALLNDHLLTSRMTPTTICPTRLVYGSKKALDIQMVNLSSEPLPGFTTRLPTQVFLRGNFTKSPIVMDKEQEFVYVAKYQFKRAGLYNFQIQIDEEEVFTGDFYVSPILKEVEFYYHLLTNQASLTPYYQHIPREKAPFAIVNSEDNYERSVMNCIGLDNLWNAQIKLYPGKNRITLSFDWDWFLEKYPVQIEEKAPGGVLAKLLAKIFPGRRYKCVKNERPHINTSFEVHNPDDFPKQQMVLFDLNNYKYVLRSNEKTSTATRSFDLDNSPPEEAARLISAITAADRGQERAMDFSGVIKEITIYHPSPLLREKLTIIDTPGIAAESAHTEMTLEIIKDKADACLFLCPADQAGTLSDFRFVKDNLLENSGEIIFVLTKSDLAGDAEELQEIIEVLREKIAENLGIANPLICPVSAWAALRSASGREQFSAFVDLIVIFSRQHREEILLKRLINVEKLVMEQLEANIAEKQKEYTSKLESLQRYVIEDLRTFIKRQEPLIEKELSIRYDVEGYTCQWLVALEEEKSGALQSIKALIDSAVDKKSLHEICESKLEGAINLYYRKVSDQYQTIAREFNEGMKTLFAEVFETFEKSFERQYPLKRIAGYRIDFNIEDYHSALIKTSSVEQELAVVREAIYSEKEAKGLGAGAGAVVGTMIMPVVGTILGGLAGFFLGSLFGPSLDEVKKEIETSIQDRLDQHFVEAVESQVRDYVVGMRSELRRTMMEAIAEYLRQYESIIRQLIQEHESKKAELQNYIEKTTNIIRELTQRRNQLVMEQEKLRIPAGLMTV